jgi:hypothetical protein
VLVWHLAGGNLAVGVGVEMLENLLGVLGWRLAPVIDRGLGSGVFAGGTLRNRRLRHWFGWFVVLPACGGRQQQRASG